MVTILEIKTTITKEILTEFSQKTFKIYHKIYRIFVLFAFLFSGFSTVTKLNTYGLSLDFVFRLLASAFFLFIFFKGYIFKLKKNYKNFQELYGELPQITSRFYDEKIDIVTSRSNLTLEYSQITKILETKNLYLMMIGRQSIILDKNGFITGDANIFKSFIKEKCKNV